MKIKLLQVVGARPNFMKVAPIFRSIEEYNFENGNAALWDGKTSKRILNIILKYFNSARN